MNKHAGEAESPEALLRRARAVSVSITRVSRPNSASSAYNYEDILEFARRADLNLKAVDAALPPALESLLSSFPEIRLDVRSEEREHVELAFSYSELRTLLLRLSIAITKRLSEEPTVSTDADRNELSRIASSIAKIEADISRLQRDAQSLRIFGKGGAVDQISVNAFIFSVPFGALRDAMAAAKKEIVRSDSPSVKFVSSLLTSASEIAGDIWNETKTLALTLPSNMARTIHSMAVASSKTASDALLLYMRIRRNAAQNRSKSYSLEARAHNLNHDRGTLIGLLEDFRSWEPTSTEVLMAGALFRHLMLARDADAARTRLSANLHSLERMRVDEAKSAVLHLAEALLSELSKEALTVEEEIARRQLPR